MVKIVFSYGSRNAAPQNSSPHNPSPNPPPKKAPLNKSGVTSTTTSTTSSTTTTNSSDTSSSSYSSSSTTTSGKSSVKTTLVDKNTGKITTTKNTENTEKSSSASSHPSSSTSSSSSSSSSSTTATNAKNATSNAKQSCKKGSLKNKNNDATKSDVPAPSRRVEPSNNNAVFFPDEYALLSFKNRKIISTNIRHFLVLFWILLFAQGTLQIGYLSILHKLLGVEPALFSVFIITPFLLPSVSLSVICSVVHILVTHCKVEKMKSKLAHKLYLISFSVMLVLDLTILVTTGMQLYLNLGSLEGSMMDILNKSVHLGITSEEFFVTQRQRSCCGVRGHEDWPPIEDKYLPEDQITDLLYYPASCCPKQDSSFDDENPFYCSTDKLWRRGCYDEERHWIITYCSCYMGLVGIGFILNICIGLHVRRIFNYCSMYRPHWLTKRQKRPRSSPGDEENLNSKVGGGDL